MSKIYPVILSGGSGTRLWPLSRAMYPKQFIQFFKDSESSFLGATLRRLSPSAGFANPILLCNTDHRFLVKDELERAGIEAGAIYLEPVARNTAAAIAVAALAVLQDRSDGIMAVMPSDHVIADEPAFTDAVHRAARVAAAGRLVLFGIKPSEAHTGFGYIRQGSPLPQSDGEAFAVDAFFEKPDAATAASYLSSGNYF
ncbi:MAG: sugar phosphate nucleotidyltransferase, partial [Hyphomicrobiaceae bacterium]